MRTLIIGIGALGGLIATRMQASRLPVWLATRNAESASALRRSGLHLTGIGGEVSAEASNIAAFDQYLTGAPFDLIVLAAKAQDAIGTAPRLTGLLGPGGVLLPVQNGGVSQILADRLGPERVLGGLSNLGATMSAPGVYEQRNAGHLLIGELTGGESKRAECVSQWLGQAVEVRVTSNLRGAAHDAWIGQILEAYGDLKPSMLQDFERGRVTEIDFINGYVVNLGRQLEIPTPLNEAIVETVQAITRRQLASSPTLLTRILAASPIKRKRSQPIARRI